MSTPTENIKAGKNYISLDEKCLIDKCLAGDMKWDDEDEMSQLLEVLSNYDCRIMVNSENVIQVIEEIAHNELLQKPQYIADCLKDIVSPLLLSFPDFAALSERYELSRPRSSSHKLPHPTPFRCVQAETIIATPSPTKASFVTLIASEEI